jgi:hypothetical protein
MNEQPLSGAPSGDVVQAGLRAVARAVRSAGPLNDEAREALAALLDELSRALTQATLDVAEVDRLTACATRFAGAARRGGGAAAPQDGGQPPGGAATVAEEHRRATAGERVEARILGLEARAPVVSGAVWRFLDALANLGI